MRAVGAALFVLSVPVALIGTNIRYLFGEQHLYDFAVAHYDVARVAGISQPELLRASSEVRQYLADDEDYLRVQVTDGAGQTGPLFNPREVIHMRDVKLLIQRIFRAQEAAIVVALGYAAVRLLAGRREGAAALLRLTWRTGIAINAAAIGFGVAAALGFDRLFTRFHTLFFSNDFWQLDPRRDHLVQMFPFPFWELAATLLVVMTVVEAVLLAVAARWTLARLEGAAEAEEPATGIAGT